ncbi:MAG: hypothetical protein HKM07_06495 [Chlamydiae bacterium]|nr:hypothetical protein [Chlamydiota bacterium]
MLPVFLDVIRTVISIDYSQTSALRIFRQSALTVSWDVWTSAATLNGKVPIPTGTNVEDYITTNTLEGKNYNKALALRKLEQVSELSPSVLLNFGEYLKEKNSEVEMIPTFLFEEKSLSTLPEKSKLENEKKHFLLIPVVVRGEGGVLQKLAKTMGCSGEHVVSFLVDFTSKTIEFYDPKGLTCEDRKGQPLRSDPRVDLPQFLNHLNQKYGEGSFTVSQNTEKNQGDLHNGGVYLCNYYERRLVEHEPSSSIFSKPLTLPEANGYRAHILSSICSVEEKEDTIQIGWEIDFKETQPPSDDFLGASVRSLRQVVSLPLDLLATALSRNTIVPSIADVHIDNFGTSEDLSRPAVLKRLQVVQEFSPETLESYRFYLEGKYSQVKMVTAFLYLNQNMNPTALPQKQALFDDNKQFLVIPVVITHPEDSYLLTLTKTMGGSGSHVVNFLVDFFSKTIEFYDPKGFTCEDRRGQPLRNDPSLDLPQFLNRLNQEYGDGVFAIVQNTKKNQGDFLNCGVYLCNYYERRLLQGESATSIFANSMTSEEANAYREQIFNQIAFLSKQPTEDIREWQLV